MAQKDIQELAQLSKSVVCEELEFVLEKAYCTIVFTKKYVIKIFCRNKREYDIEAIKHEYNWDQAMPLLSARFIESVPFRGADSSVLILNRLPENSNIMHGLVHNKLSREDIVKIGNLIKKLRNYYSKITITPKSLYKNYIANLDIQIKTLGEKGFDLLPKYKEICNNPLLLEIFEDVGKTQQAMLIHGNLFSGNIFYSQNELIVIDPISYNHIARRSFPQMDLATFLVDVQIFKRSEYLDVYEALTYDMQPCEIMLIHLYRFLKLLVRQRFAYMECKLSNKRSDANVNSIIIKNTEEILETELNHIANALERHSDK